MFDEGMIEDIQEIAENHAYLNAVERKDVSLEMLYQLPPYEELSELERALGEDNALTFDRIFHEPCGYYNIRNFLIADYAVDRAVFIKDVEAYRSMRFESARRKVAKIIYERFVAQEGRENSPYAKGTSVFQIIHQLNRQRSSEAKDAGGDAGLSASTSASAAAAGGGGAAAAAAAAAAAGAPGGRSAPHRAPPS